MTSSLAEQMVLKDDLILLDFKTEFSGRDLAEAKHKLRDITPKFSEEVEHNRDVQVVFDENQINHFLYTLLYAEKPFSLSDVIVSFLPEQF